MMRSISNFFSNRLSFLDTPKNSTKICYYYQTFVGLSQVDQLLKKYPNAVNVINISSLHFGIDPNTQKPYIHLNDNIPDDPKFDQVWNETYQLHQKYQTKIHLMLGGAGGAYQVLFGDFNTYYPMLVQLIRSKPWITGLDLDIEEFVHLSDVQSLIRHLRHDLGQSFTLTMAPIAGALISDNPGMGGFVYKDLYQSPEGKEIAWFNVQAYTDYTLTAFDQMVSNGYPASKLVYGMISDQFVSLQDFKQRALATIKQIKTKYPNFAGVFDWEYWNAPPASTKNPSEWADLIYNEIQ